MKHQAFQELVSLTTSISSLVTCIVAITAVVIGTKQLRAMAGMQEAELRPYVSVKLALLKGKTEGVELRLYNSGRTSARNIQLMFPEDQTWHNLRNPTFSFIGSGISVLNPGETLRYFLGPIRTNTSLARLKKNKIDVSIKYVDAVTKKELGDSFMLSLSDQSHEIAVKN
jgi:hypothetical protein